MKRELAARQSKESGSAHPYSVNLYPQAKSLPNETDAKDILL